MIISSFEEENASFTSMYRTLTGITESYNAGDIVTAASDYVALDRTKAAEEPLLGMLTGIDAYMQNEGFDQLVSMGTDSWNGGRLEEAENYYNLALQIKGDDPEAMFLKARLLQSQDRITEANAIFDVIVGEHPDSPYAERSVQARGY